MKMSEQSIDISSLIEMAEKGDAKSQFQLGLKYSKGEGVIQNREEATKWYLKAAEQGDAGAQNSLGVAYEKGLGVPQDYEEAVKWYRKASEQDYTKAQLNLGAMYRHGRGVPQSNEEAIAWYRKAAELGYTNAQYRLGWMYSKGDGIPQNDQEALYWYRMAAEKNHASAQTSLGYYYEKGKGIERDYKKAMELYRKAAIQENAVAQCNLGLMYEYGRGLKNKDYNKAVEWYKKSANKKYPRAILKLGIYYMNKSNYNKATELFEKISDDHDHGSKAVEYKDKIEQILISKDITDIRDDILNSLKVDITSISTMTHYTSLSVGHALLLEGSPLRLGHINAMNDPNEGKLFWRIINYHPIEGNPAFIGCFLPDSDSLNMWRFYSKNDNKDDACGCAVTYNISEFFNYSLQGGQSKYTENNTSASELNSEHTQSESFYRVVYVDGNENLLNDSEGVIESFFVKLKTAIDEFFKKEGNSEKHYELSRLLGPLPYLLKDADYKDEQEHRIIITHLAYGSKEIKFIEPDIDSERPPKLYLELHRDNHLGPISYVTLGPKAPNKEMMAPYWHHQLAMAFSRELHERNKEIKRFYIKSSKCAYK